MTLFYPGCGILFLFPFPYLEVDLAMAGVVGVGGDFAKCLPLLYTVADLDGG